MNLVSVFLVTAGVAPVAIPVMLLVRRRAREAIGGDVRIPCNAEGNAA